MTASCPFEGTVIARCPCMKESDMDRSGYVMDLMSRAPVVVGPQTLTSAAAEHAARHGVHYLLVIEGYRLRGVVCVCDLQQALPERPVMHCMHSPVTIEDQASGEQCVE